MLGRLESVYCTSLTETDVPNLTPEGRMAATDAVDLHSTQEEADTRMFLHAFHASADGHHSIAVFSSDTDVEVLASQHQAAIPAEIILIRAQGVDRVW